MRFEQAPKISSEKRFTLSKELFAQERIEAVKNAVDGIKHDHPEVLSLCMYGSMVKGVAKSESDIDGYLFVDSAEVAHNESKTEDEILETETRESGVKTFFIDEFEKKYTAELREKVKSAADLSDEQVKHLKVRPISENIINNHLENLNEYEAEEELYDAQVRQWRVTNPERGDEKADLKEVLAYYESAPKRPHYILPSQNLFGMFHLDVGGGVRKYRGLLLERLGEMGERGERIWETIIERTEEMEQNLTAGTKKRYPRTLQEALVLYGSKNN